MKFSRSHFVTLVIGLAIGMGIASFHTPSTPKPETATTSSTPEFNENSMLSDPEIVVMYPSPDGKQLYLVYELKTRNVFLKTPIGRESGLAENELDTLKTEAVRIASSRKPVQVGGSLTFEFDGTYPEWGPAEEWTGEGRKRVLLIAKDAVLTQDGILKAYGSDSQPSYAPYPDMRALKNK